MKFLFLRSSAVIAALAVCLVVSTSHAGEIILYDADPDDDIGTPAPDPTTMGWEITNLDEQVTAATFSNSGATTGGAEAWILDDTGPTGNTATGNQSNSLHYDFSPGLVDLMGSDFVLTMEFEQLSDGSFVGFAYNHDGATDDFGLTGDTRYGQSPDSGLQTFVTSWDGSTLTLNPGAGGPGGFSTFWGGSVDGGMRIFFGDNTRNSVAFNLAITKVTLSGSNIPEPTSIALAGLGLIGLLGMRRRR